MYSSPWLSQAVGPNSYYQNYELRKTIGMENPWNYRNKAQFQLRQIDGQVEAGS
jgi:tRNA/tmRNA/rRNA uracil-C5-methylase (TrmA/RlmC/RlmD family)